MATMDRDEWGSDVPISAPVPRDDLHGLPFVDLGGFAFTASGMVLPVTSALAEERYSPTWSPQRTFTDREES